MVAAGHPTSLGPVTLRPASAMDYLAASARAFRSSDRAASSSGPQISGKVTDSRGKPLAGICVDASLAGRGGANPGPAGPGVKTGRNGKYQIGNGRLSPGRWKVFFSVGCGNKGNFAPQWRKSAATEKRAKVLVLHKNTHLTGINARLGKGASISGIVRAGSKSGPGLAGVCVEADAFSAEQFAQTKTGRGGKYLVTGLGTGRYTVYFSPGCGNKGNFTQAPFPPTVSVADGKTTKRVDGFLPRAGEISGTVTTGPQHRPLAGICVIGVAGSAGIGQAFETSSGPTGHYSFSELAPGRYEVGFSAGCGSKGSFAPQFYKNQVTETASTLVLVRGGSNVHGINAVMKPGGIVTGTVTSGRERLTGICVLLAQQSEDTGSDFGILLGGGIGALPFGAIARTIDGRFRASNLPPGNYAVSFFSGCEAGGPTEASQWFSPQGDDRMSLLTVGRGTLTGIDAKLSAPGTITGVVTGPDGKPVRGICVFPIGLTGEPSNALAELVNGSDGLESNKQGVYRLTGLATGKYGLEFIPCQSTSLAPQWYRQATETAGLTPVAVRDGQVTADIDEKMVTGQSISGRITTAGSHRPVGGACVIAADASGNSLGFGRSRKNGTYLVGHLAAGTYSLQAGPCAGGALAIVVRSHLKVGSSKPLTGINVALPVAGQVAGRVTGGRPASPLGGACVTATPKTGAGLPGTSFARSDGTYSVGGLAPGKYRVEFSSLCVLSPGGFVSQWFDRKTTRGQATPVTVASGRKTAGIDATLVADGGISGSVRVAGSPRTGVCVLAFPKAGGTPTAGESGANGSYLIKGLSPGQYVVEFTSGCGVASYPTQWFDGAVSRTGATPVTVKAGSVTTAIDAH
jgi:hypothetical protein